jgi:hypothetical protein
MKTHLVSKFHRGSSTFPCNVCGRLTRDTGVQSAGNKICPQCYELAGIENSISDGHETLESQKSNIESYVKEIEGKGGNVAEWKETFKL